MALYDIITSADHATEDVATRIATELDRLFEYHQFEFRSDVDECIDDSDDWLVGTLESRQYGVCINVYCSGVRQTIKTHVETDTDQWWVNGIATAEGLLDVVNEAAEQDQTQRTLATD